MGGVASMSRILSSRGLPLPYEFGLLQQASQQVDVLAQSRQGPVMTVPRGGLSPHGGILSDSMPLAKTIPPGVHPDAVAELAQVLDPDCRETAPSLWYRFGDRVGSGTVVAYEGSGNVAALTRNADGSETIFLRTAEALAQEGTESGRKIFERTIQRVGDECRVTRIAFDVSSSLALKSDRAVTACLHEFFPAVLGHASVDPDDGEERVLHQWVWYLADYLTDLFPGAPIIVGGRHAEPRVTLDADGFTFADFESRFVGDQYATLQVAGATLIYHGSEHSLRFTVGFASDQNSAGADQLFGDMQAAYLRHLESLESEVRSALRVE